MKIFTAVVEKCPDTGLYVGFVPGFPGAHSQAETLDELNKNLQEVLGALLENGEPKLECEFVGTQEPYEGNLHVRVCGGERRVTGASTRNLTANS